MAKSEASVCTDHGWVWSGNQHFYYLPLGHRSAHWRSSHFARLDIQS